MRSGANYQAPIQQRPGGFKLACGGASVALVRLDSGMSRLRTHRSEEGIMSKHGLLGKLFAVSVGLLVLASATDAEARKWGKKKAAAANEPAAIEKAPRLKPSKVKFGKSEKQIVKAYRHIIEARYKKARQEASPGIELDQVTRAMNQAKQDFASSRIEFDDMPGPLDGTRFVGEFSRMNAEKALVMKRKKRSRHFFFIKNRLWKVMDTYRLGSRSKWGADFKEAAKKVEKIMGVPGRRLAADPAKGRKYEEIDWADAKVHVRIINWGKKLGVAYVDKDTEANLENLRTHKPKKKEELDPSVKSVLRK